MTWEWKLLIKNCTGCGICADVCTEDALKMTKDMAYPEPVPGKCNGCMTCLKECPFSALKVEELLPSGIFW